MESVTARLVEILLERLWVVGKTDGKDERWTNSHTYE